jgi:DNA-binding helix-turn-helix protein
MILKQARKERNLTLKVLSELTDISISELNKLENGLIKEPCSVFLYRLSEVLNLDYEEMLKYRFASYYRKKGIINV